MHNLSVSYSMAYWKMPPEAQVCKYYTSRTNTGNISFTHVTSFTLSIHMNIQQPALKENPKMWFKKKWQKRIAIHLKFCYFMLFQVVGVCGTFLLKYTIWLLIMYIIKKAMLYAEYITSTHNHTKYYQSLKCAFKGNAQYVNVDICDINTWPKLYLDFEIDSLQTYSYLPIYLLLLIRYTLLCSMVKVFRILLSIHCKI